MLQTVPTMLHIYLLLAIFSFIPSKVLGSYIPPYYEGSPISMKVTSLDPPNFTREPAYKIEFVLKTDASPEESTTFGFVHRLKYPTAHFRREILNITSLF